MLSGLYWAVSVSLSSLISCSHITLGFLKAPPLPVSSSPLPVEELMDMTPVPKKVAAAAAFIAGSETQLSSPASPSPDDQMMLESPCPGPQPVAILEQSRPLSSALEYDLAFH